MISRSMISSFSSSSFVASTATTATGDAKAPVKDRLEEKAEDGTTGLTD